MPREVNTPNILRDERYQAKWFESRRTWKYSIFMLVFAGSVLLPLGWLFQSWSSIDFELWQHLWDTQLTTLLWNSARLAVGVFCGVVLLGASLAWVIALHDFPGRSFFEWALVLPFAIPAYVFAFILLGSLDSSVTGWPIGLRNYWGVCLSFTLAFFPYVYLLTKNALVSQGDRVYEVARTLGCSSWGLLFRVAMPIAWPSIVAGASLAVMEAFADFGTVSIFNYLTFTTAIYKAWFGFFSLQTAAQLATFLVFIVLLWRGLEGFMLKGRSPGNEQGVGASGVRRSRLNPTAGWCVFVMLSLLLCFSFIMPMARLVFWVIESMDKQSFTDLMAIFARSFGLGAAGAAIVTLGAFFVAVVARNDVRRRVITAIRIATLGYALPGSILAVGLMLVFASVDSLNSQLGFDTRFVGGVFVLIMAYVVRFLAVGYSGALSSLSLLQQHIIDAAKVLGASPIRRLYAVYLPILTPGIGATFLLVLVDILKEMPATLLLRPFGWDTLAVSIYSYTAEGDWALAALPACGLVVMGLVPVYILVKRLSV